MVQIPNEIILYVLIQLVQLEFFEVGHFAGIEILDHFELAVSMDGEQIYKIIVPDRAYKKPQSTITVEYFGSDLSVNAGSEVYVDYQDGKVDVSILNGTYFLLIVKK